MIHLILDFLLDGANEIAGTGELTPEQLEEIYEMIVQTIMIAL